MKRPLLLLYHSVAADGAECGESTRIPLAQFTEQMDLLRELGYRTIGLQDLRERLEKKAGFGTREMLITFDDGYRDNYETAWPVLLERKFTAVFFLATAWIGGISHFNEHLPLPMISWQQAEAMARQGAEFGAHGHNHRDLSALPLEQAEADLRQAKDALSAALSPAVLAIAYPYGFSTPMVRQRSREAGYQLGFGVERKWGLDRFDLPRLTVTRGEPLWRFRLRLRYREALG